MQRPSSRIIKEYSIIEQFKNAHIKAVFNLQLPGEHPYCGDNMIKESGFTYKAEDFTDHGIFFFNFGWTDMTVTNNDYMIKIITHMDFILSQGMKVSVHCHAGTGRTGLVIASWLIIKNNMTATEARDLFRQNRSGGLSKEKQLNFLKNFENFLNKTRISFSPKITIKIDEMITNQEKLVFGKVKSLSRYQPQIMYQILSRLEFMMENTRIDAAQLCTSFFDPDNKDLFPNSKWTQANEQQIEQLKVQINQFQWQFSNYGDLRVLSQTLLDFFDQNNQQVIKNESAIKLDEYLIELKQIELVFAHENIVELLGRCEYSILSKFLEFIKRNFIEKKLPQSSINQFLLRICISLLGKRSELDNLFISRSFMTTECFNPIVINLYQFLSAWLTEMVEHEMQDNTYFDKIFNRTSCILEGRAKMQSSSNKKVVNNSFSAIKEKSFQTRAETILIGNHTKNESVRANNKRDFKSVSIFTDINQPMQSRSQIQPLSPEITSIKQFQSEYVSGKSGEISLKDSQQIEENKFN